MSKRWTQEDLSQFKNQSGRKPQTPLQGETKLMPGKPLKYGNVQVMIDGWTFDSKLEGARYEELKLMRAAGKVKYFLCQVPFRLPGHVIFRVDFQIHWGTGLFDGGVTYEDAHGADSALKTLKLKQLREIYGVEVKLVRTAGGR